MKDKDLIQWLGKDNELGIDIWNNKYRNEEETFNEWLDRISNGNSTLRALILEKKFIFAGRILANRGLHKLGKKITYSNCYVLPPVEDNIESIFDTASKLARTYSYGGGCGVDISGLAPSGAKVNNAAKTTSGSTSFMRLFSLVTELIGQNGRRGALMISLSCDHPDLIDFIKLKADLDVVTKANISVRITDKFMKAVENREKHKLTFIRKETGEEITNEVDAYETLKLISDTSWDVGEPGTLFWDRISKYNLVSEDPNFKYAGVNPCAEEPLPAGGSCLLGSINLSEFVRNGEFDYTAFKHTVAIAIKALNDVLDEGLSLHPLQIQQNTVRDWRQIGLGIFGLADMLIKLGIRYGSKEAVRISNKIGKCMADQAIKTSASYNDPYPMYNDCVLRSKYFIDNTYSRTKALVKKNGLRNSQLLTIAPTGSISTMLGVSGGIEPIYSNYYERKTESLHGEDVYYKVYTPIAKEYMDAHNITNDEDLPDYFTTAMKLNYIERINMQSAWQNHIDASISSTVNVPQDFTVENVVELYQYAHKMGLKGVTIFRDGCRRAGILSTKGKEEEEVVELKRGEVIKVKNNGIGKERHLTTGCGSLHCTAFFDPTTGQLLETYLSKGSTGGCQSNLAAVSRLMSLSARGGISILDIVDQLGSCIACPSYAVRAATKHDASVGSSCPVAIANALMDMYTEMLSEIKSSTKQLPEGKKDITKIDRANSINETIINKKANKAYSDSAKLTEKKVIIVDMGGKCPQCGAALAQTGGCIQCNSCGWSKCN